MANYAAHRNGDLRTCGATTIVQGQDFVFVNGKLWSVIGDPNTHGDGQLIPSHSGIYISGKSVIVNTPDNASTDDNGDIDPATAQGSTNVFAY